MSTPLEDSLPHFPAGKIAQRGLSSHEPGRQETGPRKCPSGPLSAVAVGEAWLPHHPYHCPVSPGDIAGVPVSEVSRATEAQQDKTTARWGPWSGGHRLLGHTWPERSPQPSLTTSPPLSPPCR